MKHHAHRRAPAGRRRQAGAAALSVTLLVFLVLTLVLAFSNRQLVFEQRSASNQMRAAVSLEAAQAGLDWAQALINSPVPIDSACEATANGGGVAASGAKTWRDMQLVYSPGTRLQLSQPGLTSACLRDGTGWRCHCPQKGAASMSLPTGDTPLPGFVVQLADSPEPGHVLLRAKGCSQAGPDCWDTAQATPAGQAQSRLQVQLALAGGLRTPPAAALTALGGVHGPALGAHHGEAGGVAVHAGGGIQLSAASSTGTVAGGSRGQAQAANDADLAAMASGQLFSALWGMGAARWSAQSSVLQLPPCAGQCGAALQSAIAQRGNRMVWIAGDATLDGTPSAGGPLQLGSADEPLLLVVAGQLTLLGAVQLHGAVYADELRWNNAQAADAFLRGAAWSQTGMHSDSAPQFFFDPAVLARLRWNTGSFTVLPGSWKDTAP